MNHRPQPTVPLPRSVLTAAWFLIALAYLAFFLVDLRLDYDQLRTPCTGPDCNYLAISPAEAAALDAMGLTMSVYTWSVLSASVLNVLVFWLLGALILSRQGSTWIGWTVSLALIVIPVTMITDPGNVANHFPGLFVPSVLLSTVGLCIMTLFIYLFPSGRFFPRWAFAVLAVGLPVSIVAFFETQFRFSVPTFLASVLEIVLLGNIFLAGVFQFFRYRSDSSPVERQQTKWMLFGLGALLLSFPLWFYVFEAGPDIPPGQPRLLASFGGWVLVMLLSGLLPVTIALAILRYRLWDIDLLIRRTLIYTFLTALLAGLYFGSVTLLQNVLFAASGQQSTAAIVISTLGIAALFNPLRQRVQAAIDRRFYRARYNAEQSLARFAAAARDEVDLGKLAGELQLVVEETMRPERTSLWLRQGD